MKQKILNSIKHPLISGSIVMFVGSIFGSVLNFLFNLFMSRNLTVADYGILASLTSVLSLAMVITGSAVPMIVNFAAGYFATNDIVHVRGLFLKVTKYYLGMGIVALLVFLIFPQQIGQFFKIHQVPLIILCGFTIFIIFIGTVNGALLQANLSFRYISFINFMGALTKVLMGVLLFMIGWKVGGAVWAVFAGFLVPYILSFYPLRFLFGNKLDTPKLNVKELFIYGAPAALALFCVTSLISTDIILVKHFFPPDKAGIYAGLSLVGRVIFFLTAPIPTVMFPLIAQKYAKKEAYDNIFLMSFFIVLLPSLAITLFYFIFPTFSIEIFIKKKEYLQAAGLLGFFGIYITMYSLLNVFTNFYLSIKKTKIWIPVSIGAAAQAILIWLFHQTFAEVVSISLGITTVLLILFIGYYFVLKNRK